MKENQKDSKSQSSSKEQEKNTTNKSQKLSDAKPSTEDTAGDEKNKEGTKMPGRETRTHVADKKSTTQDKSQNKKDSM